jgi:hypothetical protein
VADPAPGLPVEAAAKAAADAAKDVLDAAGS